MVEAWHSSKTFQIDILKVAKFGVSRIFDFWAIKHSLSQDKNDPLPKA